MRGWMKSLEQPLKEHGWAGTPQTTQISAPSCSSCTQLPLQFYGSALLGRWSLQCRINGQKHPYTEKKSMYRQIVTAQSKHPPQREGHKSCQHLVLCCVRGTICKPHQIFQPQPSAPNWEHQHLGSVVTMLSVKWWTGAVAGQRNLSFISSANKQQPSVLERANCLIKESEKL